MNIGLAGSVCWYHVVMSTNKTKIDLAVAEGFMRSLLNLPGVKLIPIDAGETAQAYFFQTDDGPRVLRVNMHRDFGFHKDQYCYDHFASSHVPIPKILGIGEIEAGLYYSISERVSGKTLDKFNTDQINNLMPQIIDTLDHIHQTAPLGSGYGNIELSGNAKSSTWREKMEKNLVTEDEETTSAEFYKEDYAEKLRSEVRALLSVVSEVRNLIHCDYGFENTVSDGVSINGVIDWEHATYGDFMYDVAWLDYWNAKQGYATAFKQYYDQQNRKVDNFNERLMMYKIFIGYGAMGFFARSRQQDKYDFAKAEVNKLLTK